MTEAIIAWELAQYKRSLTKRAGGKKNQSRKSKGKDETKITPEALKYYFLNEADDGKSIPELAQQLRVDAKVLVSLPSKGIFPSPNSCASQGPGGAQLFTAGNASKRRLMQAASAHAPFASFQSRDIRTNRDSISELR